MGQEENPEHLVQSTSFPIQTHTPLHRPNSRRAATHPRSHSRSRLEVEPQLVIPLLQSSLFPRMGKVTFWGNNFWHHPPCHNPHPLPPFPASVFHPPTLSWVWVWGPGRKEPTCPAHLQAMPSHSRASRQRSSTARLSPRATTAHGRSLSATGTTRAMAEVTLPALRSIEISTSKAGWAVWGERGRVHRCQSYSQQ